MSFREKLSEKPALAVAIAAVLIGLAAWFASGSRKKPVVEQSYYYDVDQNRLFTDDTGKTPPFKTPAGQTAVVAAVFSCGNCADASSRFIGYIQKYSDAYLASRGKPDVPADVIEQGQLIRLEKGDPWVPASSEPGRKITGDVRNRCGDQAPKACHP